MDDREYFIRLFKTLQTKLRFPNDKGAQNAWQVYEPSFFTQVLSSEQNREIYAEAFDFSVDTPDNKNTLIKEDVKPDVKPDAKPEVKPDAKPDDVKPENVEPNTDEAPPEIQILKTAPTLVEIVLQFMLDNYKGGPFNENVQLSDKVWIGEHLNVDIPVEDLVELDNPVFWRRVAKAKCSEIVKLQECSRDAEFDWKVLGIECKLQNIFENTSRESWDEEKMAKISKAVSPFVFQLKIEQLIGLCPALLEKNQYNPLYKIFNYPPKDCHHGNLGAALAHLSNLHSLTLQFGIKNMEYNYHLRHFEVSYEDIENLSSGLEKLQNLRILIIINSRLDDRKCKTLMKGLLSCSLERLELSCCHLEDNSGKAIGYYLQNCPDTLKELELRDNYMSGSGIQGVGYGIQEYSGELEFIGLAGNPIGESGLVALGSSFCLREQVKHIDISRCDIRGEGPFRIVQMVGFHERLESLNISAVHIGEVIGENLVAVLKERWNLLKFEVRGCGLTENQQRKVKMIVARNIFYKENPCMRKDYFEEKDAIEIDDWVAKPKHPMLLKVFARLPSPDHCNEYDPPQQINKVHIPSFIPESQRKVVSTSEILGINYIDYVAPDKEANKDGVTDGSLSNLKPNQFTLNQFHSSVLLGNVADLSCKQYFNK